MTPEQAAGAAKPGVLELGTAFAECPGTLRRARLMGIGGWAFHVTSRGGVLGQVSAPTVAAALGFIAPDAVAEGWEAATSVAPPTEVAAMARTECCRWGVEQLSGCSRVVRLAELAHRVVSAADAAAMPLFAAWRAVPVPADAAPSARAAVLLHLLREYLCGAHLIAVRASGMTPLEAVVAGPEGESGALANGWPPPYPPIGPLIRRRLWAASVTDRIAAGAFAALDAGERMELINLLDAIRTGLRRSPTGRA